MAVPSEKKPLEANGKKIEKSEKNKVKDESELSEDDLQLKTDLDLLVQRLQEPQEDLYQASIDQLGTLIRTSTSSMTAVPKP